MDYLRSKVVQIDEAMEEGEEKDDGEEVDNEDEDVGPVQHADSAYESGDRENIAKTKTSVSSEDKKQGKAKKSAKQEVSENMKWNIKVHPHVFSVCSG